MEEGSLQYSVKYFDLCRKMMVAFLSLNVFENFMAMLSNRFARHSKLDILDMLKFCSSYDATGLYVFSDSLALPRLVNLPTTEKNAYNELSGKNFVCS